MTLQVYRHRVRRSTDILLGRAMMLAAGEKPGEIRRLYTYSGPSATFCSRWLRYTDRTLTDSIVARGGTSEAARLVSHLMSRRLSFRVLSMPLDQLDPTYQKRFTTPSEQRQLEQRIASQCLTKMNTHRIVVDVVRTVPPRPSSSEPDIDPEEILVRTERAPCRFHQVSDVFARNPLIGKDLLAVYMPLAAEQREERQRERRALRRSIEAIIRHREKEVTRGR
jgi:hypothetical protein